MLELWLPAFLITIALEAPIVALATRELGLARGLALGVLVQAVTHPALWFVAPAPVHYLHWLAVSEGVVVLVEALCIGVALVTVLPARAACTRALLASFAANLLSTAVGMLLWRLLGLG